MSTTDRTNNTPTIWRLQLTGQVAGMPHVSARITPRGERSPEIIVDAPLDSAWIDELTRIASRTGDYLDLPNAEIGTPCTRFTSPDHAIQAAIITFLDDDHFHDGDVLRIGGSGRFWDFVRRLPSSGPKVGDVVFRREDLDALPLGSVVIGENDWPWVRLAHNTSWRGSVALWDGILGSSRTSREMIESVCPSVIYIPGEGVERPLTRGGETASE